MQDDASIIAKIQDDIRRLKGRSDPGGGSAWAEISGDGFVGEMGPQAVANISSIDHQSGGFTQVDDYTVQLPHGVFTVDWVFSVMINLRDDYADWLTETNDVGVPHWTMWTGGPASPTNSVIEESVFDRVMLDVFHFLTFSDHAAFRTGPDGHAVQWHLRQTVRSDPNNDLLSLGLWSIDYVFHNHVPDFTPGDRAIFFASPLEASGESFVKIHGSTEAEV